VDTGQLLAIAVGAVLVNNFVLARFLGLCPFLGVSKQLDSALGMGFAVIFVMTLASVASFGIYTLVLVPLHLEFLKTIAFILAIATLVQFVEMVIERSSRELYGALGIYLPLITTNCAVLGVAILNIEKSYGLAATTVHGLACGVGFALALVLMAGLRERVELGPVPEFLKGFPISFIMAGLMAIAFLGFTGLISQ
jgi:Na+-translocating ferredoxin:NAD+ oxidoreductase subunit A